MAVAGRARSTATDSPDVADWARRRDGATAWIQRDLDRYPVTSAAGARDDCVASGTVVELGASTVVDVVRVAGTVVEAGASTVVVGASGAVVLVVPPGGAVVLVVGGGGGGGGVVVVLVAGWQ